MDNSRVFISSLPWAVSKATILNLLSELHLVSQHIQVVRKGSFHQNGSFCSAFVTFENADMAVRAIGLLDGRVDSRVGTVALKAEMARPKPTSRRSRSRTPARVPKPKVQLGLNATQPAVAEKTMDEPTAAGAQNSQDEPSTAAAHKDNKPNEATLMVRQPRFWLFVLRPLCWDQKGDLKVEGFGSRVWFGCPCSPQQPSYWAGRRYSHRQAGQAKYCCSPS